jgi:RND family efflux transporter MFP subunit
MFKKFPVRGRTLALFLGVIPLVVLFVFVVFRSGPLASVAVTVATPEKKTIAPAIFGIGTIEARRTYKIGPIAAGRLMTLEVDVGERVTAGRLLGEMDPVDLDDRIQAQSAVLKQVEAQRVDAQTRQLYAKKQAQRYEQLLVVRSTSEETHATKKHEYQLSEAGLSASEQQYARAQSDYEALVTQRKNLKLLAPVDGLISLRKAEPGTTLVAGQAAIEIIDPTTLWVNVRFDQVNSKGLTLGLPAQIRLRSEREQIHAGQIARVELMADPVTEEMSAKINFDRPFVIMPPVGELAEITVLLPLLESVQVLPNTSVKRINGVTGVWQVIDERLRFTSVKIGALDLDGSVQILEGLSPDAKVVVYSEQALSASSRVRVVKNIPGIDK